jgi:hypothetical protein
MRGEQFEIGLAQAVARRVALVAVGIEQRRDADIVEALALFGGQRQFGGGEIILELRFGASADDD